MLLLISQKLPSIYYGQIAIPHQPAGSINSTIPMRKYIAYVSAHKYIASITWRLKIHQLSQYIQYIYSHTYHYEHLHIIYRVLNRISKACGGGPDTHLRQSYALKNLTTRTIYCRQIGHSGSTFPQLVQVAMWPHSRNTHSMGASMQILQSSSVGSFSTAARREADQ